jgi:hypothetical protein
MSAYGFAINELPETRLREEFRFFATPIRIKQSGNEKSAK